MFLKRRSSNWNTAKDVCSSRKFLGGVMPERLAILDAVWEKEAGALNRHCSLLGVDGCYLVVRPRSAAAASEITLRGPLIVKGLNKYFKRPWIKAIRTATRL